ncbi:MAG: sulfotransferase family 2 domain-containing protein [Planctomycetota bacterium]|jgi:hypothetical protein
MSDFLCIIDQIHGWAHVSIPKCACTSIRRALEKHFELDAAQNPHGRVWPKTGDRAWLLNHPGFFRWAAIRDPRDRLVSVWAEKTQQNLPDGLPGLAGCYRNLLGCSFERFVSWVTTQPVETRLADVHIRAMSWWLLVKSQCVVDVVYRLPDLSAAWRKLQDQYGLPALEHRNSSTHGPWQEYVTPGMDRAIRRAYRQDFFRWFG